MKDRLVTLFGGGGFVGRPLTQALLAAGARVRIAQRDPRGAAALKTLGGLGKTQFVAVDLTRPQGIARAIAGSDAVVNLVGSFGGDLNAIHVEGARRLADEAANAGVGAFVHVSAIGADPQSASRYGRTKGEGEAAVRAAFPAATILRPSTIFGRDDAFVNRFAGLIAQLPVVPVLRGEAKFQPVFVGDVVHAVVTALGDPGRFGGRTIELGGPDVLTMAELNAWIAHATGRTPAFLSVPDAIGGMIAKLGFLPGAPITSDQWAMLQSDAIVAPGADDFATLGIVPTPLAAVAPEWLVRFRRNGRFNTSASA